MPELVISHQDRLVFRLPLESQSTTIGRSHDNDLILAGEAVSRQHAVIFRRQEEFWLEDHSSQGTFVNGVRVDGHVRLSGGAEIKIHDWHIVYEPNSEKLKQDEINRHTQITKILALETKEDTQLLKFSSSVSSYKKMRPLLIIDDVGAGKSSLTVKKRQLMVGSSDECDVVLKDPFVSKKHALFELRDLGFCVIDLDSKNGTMVEGAKVKECYIREHKEISLGQSKILVRFDEQKDSVVTPIAADQFCGMIGVSSVMKDFFARVQLVAATDMTVLILGETGTGKEMIARAIFDLSSRRAKPFVVLNCGAISPHLIESEIFGHEKGAFTGAEQKHEGVFEQAHGGTVFLDEVGELPLDLQAKILRVLEYQTLRRVGGKQEIKVDVRLIAATHRNLAHMVEEGQFRADLFYRLYVLPLTVPALCERGDDVVLLAKHFVQEFGNGRSDLLPEAIAKIQGHTWPGNVRELKNTMLRALTFCRNGRISDQDIEILDLSSKTKKYFEDVEESGYLHPAAKDDFERERIAKALDHFGGDKVKVAQALKMGRSTLFRKIKDLGI